MSQNESPETRQKRVKSKTAVKPRADKVEKKRLCRVHDKVRDWEVDGIRRNVCVNDEELIPHEHGEYYCLFHLPTTEKDEEKFEKEFRERLKVIEEKITGIENLDDDAKEPAKQEIIYDFRYVFFPSYLDLGDYKFSADAYFSSATFSTDAYFSSATFSAYAGFNSATFSAYAGFPSATFSADTDFSGATFSAMTNFNSATFSALADFSSTTFSAYSYFRGATFSANADFKWAKFNITSQTFFLGTEFHSILSLAEAEIDGFVEFERAVFLGESSIPEIDDAVNKEEVGEKSEAYLDLKARLIRQESVSFNSMKLRPCWFVNVEARNLVFNDVEWQNLEIDVDRSGLDREFQTLIDFKIQRPKESLIKACNQLADNAEANRRFEEARLFRKQSIALRKYECHIHDETDPGKKDNIRRNVCRDYPVVNEDGGNYYCLWHNPDKNKAEIFLREFEKRREEGQTDFRSVVFPISIEYTGELSGDLNFTGATFYHRVVFENAEINNLNFNEAYFTDISELVIKNSVCRGKINFDKASIEGKVFLNGKNERVLFMNPANALSLKDAQIEKTHWINFRSIRLLPHYFVDVDASKFVFLDCEWRDANEKDFVIAEEIMRPSHKEIAQTCNQLAANYEENRHYDESSDFRYGAMEAKRLGYKSTFTKIFNLYWLYKWTSGYGESRLWATFVLLVLIGLFSVFYATDFASFDYGENPPKPAETFVGQTCDKMRVIGNPNGMTVCDGIVHSLAVASFQRPDPKPNDALTKFLVTLETILVPIQAALLALAIRRKFMR
ncbi:MAG TPA: pentapeptide repeat-containing protein [Pyrinomonadaceae bacterium]|nr:pentapeptide repeat-containing protein [Pyrinomonadaceae bacterium]